MLIVAIAVADGAHDVDNTDISNSGHISHDPLWLAQFDDGAAATCAILVPITRAHHDQLDHDHLIMLRPSCFPDCSRSSGRQRRGG